MKNLLVSLVVVAVLSSPAARATTLTVTSTADDGSVGTLRSLLAGAADGDTIDFSVTGTITLTTGQLAVNESVEILGPGANNLAIDGNAASRVFYIASGKTVSISGLSITHGNVGGFAGGGIYNDRATLTLSQCAVSGNVASGSGGGMYNNGSPGSASLKVVNCTLSGNSSSSGGGGICNDGGGLAGNATLEIVNSTLSGNSAGTYHGGGIVNFGAGGGSASLKIVNSTLSGNSAGGGGGGVYLIGLDGTASLTIGSTILNAGASGGNIQNDGATVTSLGYNLSSDGAGGFLTATGDQINTDPLLGSLQDNDGPTFTHSPSCGSPAIDKGKNFTTSATDQRGAMRTFDEPNIINAVGGDGSDISAVETPVAAFLVTNTDDSGAGSLRQAILDANARPGSDIIEFAPGVNGTIKLTTGELLITDCLFINGPGATNLAVKGNYPNPINRVFHVGSGINVTIAGLTITNGYAPNSESDGGGGIRNDHSTLTVSNCTVSGNFAPYVGGGIYNDGDHSARASLELVNSTVSGNSSSFHGGGIANEGNNGGSASTRRAIGSRWTLIR